MSRPRNKITMKTVIIEMEESAPITANLDDHLTGCLTRVAALARVGLENPKIHTFFAARDQLFIPMLERGAARLAVLGEPGARLVISDSLYIIDTHLAACLAARKPEFTNDEKYDILTVLGLLAGLYPCWLAARYLPAPWEEIDLGTTLERAGQIYEKVRQAHPDDEGFVLLTMAEALVLRVALPVKAHGSLLPLWEDLDEVTRAHRQALARLMQTGGTP
jgi:hypothetical protein